VEGVPAGFAGVRGAGQRVFDVDEVWRVNRLALSAALFGSILTQPALAADSEYFGKGYDCRFQSEIDRLVPFSVWYGRINKAPDSVPQVQDTEKLFALAGLHAGARMIVHAADEWPAKFTLNYFEDRGKGRPSALFVVYGQSNNTGSFLADITQFSLEPDPANPDRIVALKRYRGICKASAAVSFAEFRNGLPK
jgi:hypothetical protein